MMTDEDLAAIREALNMPEVQFDDAMLTLNRLVPRLLATVEAYRDIVQEVAHGPSSLFGLFPAMYLCNYCDVYIGGIFGRTDHRAECPVAKARALLGKENA